MIVPRQDYDLHRERARARQAAASRSGRDIGPLPPPEDPDRRQRALDSLQTFYEEYFPDTFYLPWSSAHIQSIKDIQRTIENREKLAEAMPRGWGKTSRFERAALWAGLRGSSRFCLIIGESEDAAGDILDSIKMELETNDRLAADFPEVCYPIRALERITLRARGQTYQGRPTYITWEGHKIVLPTIPGGAGSGFIIRVAGIVGRVRGMKESSPSGKTVRPDLALLDDPQTDASAANPAQVEKRHRLINSAVLRLAGPDQRVAAMGSVTVIRPDDLADRLIDRQASPQWHGRRYQTVDAFPMKEPGSTKFDPAWWALWQQYEAARARGMNREDGGKSARKFYRKNRLDLDAGVVVNWEHKIEPGDLSAIQSAMNWLLDDAESFWAEGQNKPKPPDATQDTYQVEDLLKKILPIDRGYCPPSTTVVTAFIDVQKAYLPWLIVAWTDGFGGQVLDFGTFPEQVGETYFHRRGAKYTIAKRAPGMARPEQLYGALRELVQTILGRSFPVDTESALKPAGLPVDMILIDSGYDTDTVVQFCRELHNPRVMPSKGAGLKPSDIPIPERKAKEGQKLGHHWMIHVPQTRSIRHVFMDTNRWKSIIADGLVAGQGASNTINFFKAGRKLIRILLDHLTAEYPIKTEAQGRTLDMWFLRPNRENDFFDCLVGCAVGASIRGVSAVGHKPARSGSRRRAPSSGSWSKNKNVPTHPPTRRPKNKARHYG